ncbi:hypothetical protein ACWD3I_38340 [Streptomyces sp. NPDC002817]|uniref:hypothetical protein n=1 Tax=Streptomyces sp. NPDC088357 TaxID=3154655 RepID=UPI00343DE9BF
MTPIDQLLARARLLDHRHVPRDIVPTTSTLLPALPLPTADPEQERAAGELKTLCETVLAHTAAASLQAFTTEHLPEPPGARVLGCALQLADDEDSARSWWQYAAGAGDGLAPYCLYLQHLGHGDTDAADWWLHQSRIDQETDEPDSHVPDFDDSFPTVLRVLTHLDAKTRPRTEVADAVMHYVPAAVALGYLDDPEFDMPVPGDDFAAQLGVLLAAASAASTLRAPRARRAATRLPGRRAARRPCPEQGPKE